MKWAFYLKAYDVALAATEGLDAALAHFKKEVQTEPGQIVSPIPDNEKERKKIFRNIGEALEESFIYRPPYAVDTYSTKYAKGLDYMTCRCHGVGGRPNAVLLLDDYQLALMQIRDAVNETAILQAVGLNLIMRCNKKEIAKKFRDKPKNIAVSKDVYFLTQKNLITPHTTAPGEEEKFVLYAKMLRQKIALD